MGCGGPSKEAQEPSPVAAKPESKDDRARARTGTAGKGKDSEHEEKKPKRREVRLVLLGTAYSWRGWCSYCLARTW
jgi:hypothetical protein